MMKTTKIIMTIVPGSSHNPNHNGILLHHDEGNGNDDDTSLIESRAAATGVCSHSSHPYQTHYRGGTRIIFFWNEY
jgi:hypothetical protein